MAAENNPNEPESYLNEPNWLEERIASSMDCTGLIPAAVLDEDQSESYAALYNIHRAKPEKQLFGQKTEVRNDPDVIHR